MGAPDRTPEERRLDDEVERLLYKTHCYDCAYAIAQGDWVQHPDGYCPECYRLWAESQRPLLATSWANPRNVNVAPWLQDALDDYVASLGEAEPPYRNVDDVEPLELLGRGTVVLAEAAYSLLKEAKDMNDTLSGCAWCCGGGDERMREIAEAFSRINDMAKEIEQ